MNGLGLSKGAYSIMKRDGKVSESFRPMPPSVLLVERAALVEHMISELERLEPDRLFHCSTASVYQTDSKLVHLLDKSPEHQEMGDVSWNRDGMCWWVTACKPCIALAHVHSCGPVSCFLTAVQIRIDG